MSCDPNFSEVALLLPLTGANGSTTITDYSDNAFTTNSQNGVRLETSAPAPIFGAAALDFTVGYPSAYVAYTLTAGNPLDLQSSAVDFTIEGWFYLLDTTRNQVLTSTQNPSSGGNDILLSYSSVQGTVTGQTAGGVAVSCLGGNPITANTWHHVAFVRSGSNFTTYVDGVGGTPAVGSGAIGAPQLSGLFSLGADSQTSGAMNDYNGYMCQVRVTNGLARYTSNFTPPAAGFPTIACTSATIPNIVGLTVAAANSTITGAGFTVGTATPVVPGIVGTVVSQSPAAGGSGTLGDPVSYDYATGTVVPNVVNTSVAVVAPGILTAAGFTLGAVTYAASAVIIAGNIISQSPAAGASATLGSGVDVVVSTGLPSLRVPDLYGLTETDAINLLESLGLVPGAIGAQPSKFVPPGEVQLQNPSAGTPVAAGSIVSFVLSLGVPAVGVAFDYEPTVISQYANSPTLLQLIANLNQYIDQSTNMANFYNYVWNVDTAVGFGLDIWGKIVGVSRLLHIPNTTDYVGFDNSATPPPDWQTMGSDQPPQPAVGGAMYTGYNATQTYLLPDDAYRQLILAKAFANICSTTAPAINTILQNLYGPGSAWVLNTGPMAISYNLNFTPTAIQLAILEQSGVIPTPPGVAVVVNQNV